MTDDRDIPAPANLVLARRTALLLPLAALAGCGTLDKLFSDTKKTLPGKREDVLPVNEGLQPPHGDHPTVTLPAPTAADWPVQGGNPAHYAGNAALPAYFHQVWSTSVGSGNSYRKQIMSTPLVVGDTIYVMDSLAVIGAYHVSDGRSLWRTKTKPAKSRSTNVGGGIGYADGVVYATTGYSEALALDATDGHIIWRQALDTPGRSAPTIAGGVVFLTTIDQVMQGLSTKDGKQIWSYDGTGIDTALLGQPAPAYANGIVVAGFGSGDLVAIRGDNGAVAWTDSIAAASGQVGVAEISSIAAMPVIIGELAYAIGTAGLMVAVDLRAGRRLWEREVSGIQSPVAAGDFIFITTVDQQVAALLARTGDVAWITQLPQYKRVKTKGAPIIWTGPVLADGKLIYCGTRNDMIMVDAITGAIVSTQTMPGVVTVPPIVANGTLYVITDDGQLRAYR